MRTEKEMFALILEQRKMKCFILSSNGIGSCWQGWPKPTKGILNVTNLEFVILMAFGKPNEPLYRLSVSEFKRKPLEQIRNMEGEDELLEPVRLAPTTNHGFLQEETV
ncbi:MAG: hypothetical protein N3I35_16010 [Clostridia bacterium]|nr:hypothetical protein [Clostridia bacterium]